MVAQKSARMGQTTPQVGYLLSGDYWIVMRPKPKHVPAGISQRLVDRSIALSVGCQLRLPILPVGAGHGPMVGTAMPEAAVDEDGDARLREDDIGSHRSGGEADWEVLPEPKA